MDSAEEKWREGERYEWIARVFKITQFYFRTIQISHIRMWAMKLANHTRQTTTKKTQINTHANVDEFRFRQTNYS